MQKREIRPHLNAFSLRQSENVQHCCEFRHGCLKQTMLAFGMGGFFKADNIYDISRGFLKQTTLQGNASVGFQIRVLYVTLPLSHEKRTTAIILNFIGNTLTPASQ